MISSVNQQIGSFTANEEERLHRDIAVGCAILSAAISLALCVSNFFGGNPLLDTARAGVEIHRRLLGEAEAVLQTNQNELKKNLEALENVRRAVNH